MTLVKKQSKKSEQGLFVYLFLKGQTHSKVVFVGLGEGGPLFLMSAFFSSSCSVPLIILEQKSHLTEL